MGPSDSDGYLRKTELFALGERERLAYLREHWDTDEDVIYGRLRPKEYDHRRVVWHVVGAQNEAGRTLEYPVRDLDGRSERLQKFVHVGDRPSGCADGDLVRGRFRLSPERVAVDRDNPLAIGLIPGTIERVVQVPPPDVRLADDGSALVSETLARRFVEVEHAETLAEVEALREERDVLVSGVANLKRKRRDAEKATSDAEADLEKRYEELASEWGRAWDFHQGNLTRLSEQTDELETALSTLREEKIKEMALERARHEHQIQDMREQADRLRAYTKKHAERLVRLDLITQDQRRELLGEPAPELDGLADRSTPDKIQEGWTGVVPRVQRHLLESGGIVYPQALLQAYLALVLSGDLVVLSGLSGSGKTQLVRAFADATGGVAHVVPVKPNWTSSEDLMGYYNPIQRAYLSTPFLDALIAAKRDPARIHYVCLDEMNLARVEYYFADFLSAMESRGDENPTVQLYSDEEAGHVTSEFRTFVDVVLGAAGDADDLDLGGLLSEGDVAARLQERLGLGDGESLVELHGRLRRMVSGVLNVPPELAVPPNVRVIGAVNVDETTHTLAPKVLDRAHVLRFESPLDVWELVAREVEATREAGVPGEPVYLPAGAVDRGTYPEYDPDAKDKLVGRLTEWRSEFFVPLGLDFGLRLARQAMRFRDELARVTGAAPEEVTDAALVHVLRQKVLPRFSFDGSRPPRPKPSGARRPEGSGLDVVDAFHADVKGLGAVGPYDVARELEGLLAHARSDRAGGIFNYWA